MDGVDWSVLLAAGGIPEPPGYRETTEVMQQQMAVEGPGRLPRGKGRGSSRKGKKQPLQGHVEAAQA